MVEQRSKVLEFSTTRGISPAYPCGTAWISSSSANSLTSVAVSALAAVERFLFVVHAILRLTYYGRRTIDRLKSVPLSENPNGIVGPDCSGAWFACLLFLFVVVVFRSHWWCFPVVSALEHVRLLSRNFQLQVRRFLLRRPGSFYMIHIVLCIITPRRACALAQYYIVYYYGYTWHSEKFRLEDERTRDDTRTLIA